MLSAQDFEYAMENTKVICAPKQLIETFGTTSFPFILVTEMLDDAHRVRVRCGQIDAERPRLLAPGYFQRMLLEGFGESAREFADWLEGHAEFVKILRYGFTLRKSEETEVFQAGPIEEAVERLEREMKVRGQNAALISGVDEAWEVCLLKFTADLIRQSSGENLDEWRRRGLI